MNNTSHSYTLIPHPFHKRGYQILKITPGEAGVPVGEYVVFDKKEPEEITKTKIQALQESLNQSPDHKKQARATHQYVSFQRLGAKSSDMLTEQTIFYNNTKGEYGETYRKINAVLTLSKGEVSA